MSDMSLPSDLLPSRGPRQDDQLPAYAPVDTNTYSLAEADDALAHWIDEVAVRARTLQLPLTQLKYNAAIVWQKRDGVTVGFGWRPMYKRPGRWDVRGDDAKAPLLLAQKILVEQFHALIRQGRGDAVRRFVDKGLVSPDIADGEGYDDRAIDPLAGATPLLTAVHARRIDMVKLLVDLGADVNVLARPPGLRPLDGPASRRSIDSSAQRRVRRTPLMLAAAQGHFAICKLLLTQCEADDALVAPDGQTALRLAARGRHHDIVQLLPARRGGAGRRLVHAHKQALSQVRRAADKTAVFALAVVWVVPKTVLVDVPALVLMEAWQRWQAILPALWKAIRSAPGLAVQAAVALGRGSVRAVQRVPAALQIMAGWPGHAIKTVGHAVAAVLERTVSALHTAIVAVGTLLKTATLHDIVNGVRDTLRALFLGVPRAIGRALASLGTHTYKALTAVFGGFVYLAHLVGKGLFFLATYVPKQMARIVLAVGVYLGTVLHELRLLVDPKAV